MNKGKIEQSATPDELYDTPATPFVFSFIGESSVIPVQVGNGRATLDERLLDLEVGNLPDGPAQLYLRPEDVAMVTDRRTGHSGPCRLHATDRRHAPRDDRDAVWRGTGLSPMREQNFRSPTRGACRFASSAAASCGGGSEGYEDRESWRPPPRRDFSSSAKAEGWLRWSGAVHRALLLPPIAGRRRRRRAGNQRLTGPRTAPSTACRRLRCRAAGRGNRG